MKYHRFDTRNVSLTHCHGAYDNDNEHIFQTNYIQIQTSKNYAFLGNFKFRKLKQYVILLRQFDGNHLIIVLKNIYFLYSLTSLLGHTYLPQITIHYRWK